MPLQKTKQWKAIKENKKQDTINIRTLKGKYKPDWRNISKIILLETLTL